MHKNPVSYFAGFFCLEKNLAGLLQRKSPPGHCFSSKTCAPQFILLFAPVSHVSVANLDCSAQKLIHGCQVVA